MDKPPDAATVQMLQYKNQKLVAQLELQRTEIGKLEGKLQELETKQESYQDTLLCVDRLWTQLNHDIQTMAQTASGWQQAADSTGTDAANPAASTASSLSRLDPFLERLVRSNAAAAKTVADKQQELAEGASDVEQALQQRCRVTSTAFSQLLQLIDLQQMHSQELAMQLSSPDAAQAGQQETARLVAQLEALKRELDGQTAVNRTLQAQVSQLEDQQLRDEVAIKDLKNELADKHEEVAAAQRKLVSLRTDAGAEQGAGGSLSRSQSFTAAAAAANKSQPGAGSLKEQAQAAVEVEETIKLLEKRNSQVLAEKEVNLKLQREVQDMKLAVNEESFVAQSKLYQLAQKQLQAQSADLEKQRAIIDSLQRDRDAGLHREQTLQMKAEAAEHARWALSQAEAHIGEVQGQLAAARSAGEATQVQLQAEKARMGNQSSVSELKLMIATLQKETQALKASLDKQKRATQSLEGLREEAEGAVAKVKAKDAEMQHLREKAAKQQEQVKALESKEHDLKERAADLRCFVEVLQSFCEDARDVAEVRTSESRLRSQLQAAEAQLGGKDGILSLADLRRTSAAAQAHAAELEAQNDALRVETIALKRQVEETQASLTAAKAESEAYIAEIDEIGRVYEEMQAQNSRLLAQLTERDDQNNSLVNERIKAGHAAARLAQDRDAAQAAGRRAEAGAEQLRERVVQLEARLKVSIDEAAGVREQVRSYAARLDAAQRKMREQEEALAAKQVLLEDADRAMAERKRVLEEEIEKTSKERTKRQRLEEDHQMLQSKLERLKRTEEVGGVDKMAQKELEGLRALLRCNVCHERPKDVILTTCQHMFCSECVKRNLAMRNRKCPGCGSQYGQNDVKHFYFT